MGWIGLALFSVSLFAGPIALSGCPAQTDLREDDRLTKRRRGRQGGKTRRSALRMPVLISAKRLRDAVVETNASGRPGENLERLRYRLCEDREDDAVIFYQLVVSSDWHYYWLCNDKQARRVATAKGNRLLRSWVKRITVLAEQRVADCDDAEQTLFSRVHASGTRAQASCDGRLVLSFPDGGRRTLSFQAKRAEEQCKPCPRCEAAACPKPQACPPPTTCPAPTTCPPATPCPACDCKGVLQNAGTKAFWQGVDKACRRICTLVYKKCRGIDPNTALCYQLSEYCAQNCAKR
ncbi:MAG: hypothetical protein H6707_15605 [Deltaproteobacteria bacterium]|nr:hypothetical protein [Deltaproteobacteria bacterium]